MLMMIYVLVVVVEEEEVAVVAVDNICPHSFLLLDQVEEEVGVVADRHDILA